MIEINLNFILFEALDEEPEGDRLLTRIVVIRKNKKSAAVLDDKAKTIHSSSSLPRSRFITRQRARS